MRLAAGGLLLLALVGLAAPAQAGEQEERDAKQYACGTFPAEVRARCPEIRAWPMAELRDTYAARVVDAFTLLAPAAGVDPATIRLVGMNTPEFQAGSFGEGVFVVSLKLQAQADRCLVEGVIGHELAHEKLGHARSRKTATALSGLFSALTLGLGGPPVLFAFDRHQEEAADAEGQKVLERAGRPRWEVRYWLERALHDQGDSGGFLSKHPKTSARIERLDPVPADATAICLVAPAETGRRSGASE